MGKDIKGKFILEDYTGRRFGRLLVVKRAQDKICPKGSKVTRWECICDCGNTHIAYASNLKHKQSKSCGCLQREIASNSIRLLPRKFVRSKNISGRHFSNIKNNAKKRDKEFLITIEYIQNLLVLQEFKCALTNIPINIKIDEKHTTASLDRIDSSRGYIEGNVQWVHKAVNKLKSDFSFEELLFLCRKIVEKNTN